MPTGYGNQGSVIAGVRNWLSGPQSLWGRMFGAPQSADRDRTPVQDPRRGLPGYPSGTGIRPHPPIDRRTADPATYPYTQDYGLLNEYADQIGRRRKEWAGLKNDVLGGYDDILAEINELGDAERSDIARNYARSYGQGISDLTSRGLGATTVRQGVRSSTDRERSDSLLRLNELLRNARIGVMEGRTGAVERLGVGGYTNRMSDDMGLLSKREFAETTGYQNRMNNLMNLINGGQSLGTAGFNIDSAAIQNLVNLMSGRSDLPFSGLIGPSTALFGNMNPPYATGGGGPSPAAAGGGEGLGTLGGFFNLMALERLMR